MPMVKCKECGASVSDKAMACPACGAKPPRRTSFLTWAVIATVALVVGYVYLNPSPPRVTQQPVADDSSIRARQQAEILELQAFDSAKVSVSARLKDPDSAQFGQMVYRDNGIVCGYVNAKNELGGYAGEKAFIHYRSDGSVLFEGDDQNFVSLWDKLCT